MIFASKPLRESVLRQKIDDSAYLTEYGNSGESHNSQAEYESSSILKIRQRRKTTQYGGKDRNSVIYKYMKERQEVLHHYRPRQQMSLFTPEEDRILILLVKQLGPKFSKISKYFPGKTVNMVKNRYYKSLKSVVTDEMVKVEEKKISVKHDKPRIVGKRIINQLPEERSMQNLLEESPLFPEAKVLFQSFFVGFEQFIGQCQTFQ